MTESERRAAGHRKYYASYAWAGAVSNGHGWVITWLSDPATMHMDSQASVEALIANIRESNEAFSNPNIKIIPLWWNELRG